MSSLTVSVVIPTHNRRAMLLEMLESLSRQTLQPSQFEVVVVIDGSQDGTSEMLDHLSVPYRLRSFFQPQSGVSVARNHGAQCAVGPLLVFLDDDLLPEPHLLQEHVQAHEQKSDAVVLGFLLPSNNRAKGGWNAWDERVLAKHYRAMARGTRVPGGRRLFSGNFSVGREAFLAAGGFDESLKRGEDVELGFRLEKAGHPFIFNPRAAAIHRGYRSFESWRNSAYLYGRTDVQLASRRGHRQVLQEITGWYHEKHPLLRELITLCVGRNRLRRATMEAMHAWSGTFSFFKAYALAHYGYTTIFQLQYWQGVADELGGRDALLQLVRENTNATRPKSFPPKASKT